MVERFDDWGGGGGWGSEPPGSITSPPALAMSPNICAARVAEEFDFCSLNDPDVRKRVDSTLPPGSLEKLEQGKDVAIGCGVVSVGETCKVEVAFNAKPGSNGLRIEVVDSGALTDCLETD